MIIEVALFGFRNDVDAARAALLGLIREKQPYWKMEHKRRKDGTSGWTEENPCVHWIITITEDLTVGEVLRQIDALNFGFVLGTDCRACQNKI